MEREKLDIVEVDSAKLIGNVLRLRCQENRALEISNGRQAIAMLANLADDHRPMLDGEIPYVALMR